MTGSGLGKRSLFRPKSTYFNVTEHPPTGQVLPATDWVTL
jgi:hypothetical protein